ncbi:response regulator receiver domain protein [Candidatus Moduliflexus flocculans]|uniref:histidine kinase n=1 Tax=Candidatus Moduliflexus flocculans TaxID=1499966 RepID=A0A0S6VZN1_9BACT|nr:response regulator receiver domain protein [Candidatus Moduliflexus flocculans]
MDLEQTTILAVDDNPTNLEALFDFLTRHGCTVLLKSDGAKAIALAQRRRPDLILLDIVMPGMDGFETCQRLKADEATKAIPVIFMSALTDTVDKVKGFAVGAVDYITKPFQYEKVLARVKAHLTIQKLQRDLQAQNVTLQELLEREHRLLDELRLNLSLALPHELRTPLSVISGFAQLLKMPELAENPAKVMDYAQYIHANSLRLQRLMENTLLYAHLKLLKYASRDGMNWPVHAGISTKRFVQAVAQQYAQAAGRERDLRLELKDAYLSIAPNNLKKILMELLSNAFKFSEPGMPVTISTSVNGHLCILSIRDQGRGMTREQIENIGAYMQFERREYEQQGLGLGIIIAQLLVQLEGGLLSIDSQIHKGTTVSLVVNCTTERPAVHTQRSCLWFAESNLAQKFHATGEQRVIGYRWRKMSDAPGLPETAPLQTLHAAAQPPTILVIDANQQNRNELTQLLTPLGFHVLEAVDSAEGLNMIFDSHPALILIDFQTLEMDDFELSHQIRQVAVVPPIKILAVTDMLPAIEQPKQLAAVCDALLAIPLDSQSILAEIQRLLGLETIIPSEPLAELESLASPSLLVLETLKQFALIADVYAFEQLVEASCLENPELNPFAERLLSLMKDFQFSQILRILDVCIRQKTSSQEC